MSETVLDPAMLETMTDVEIARTLRLNLPEVLDAAETIAQNPTSTIEPARRESADSQGRRALEGLGAERGGHGIASGLDMGATIGEGGMGIVRIATQRALGRPVAVKTLRPDTRSDAATLRLLREAWVTGSLEHPNIVPVYDLGLDDDGTPIIILKRIEGLEWASSIHDSGETKARHGAEDHLEHNLKILVQLCNAVSLAHSRGVVHRDLKPENVMIGRFGEVYLVDWGIAVSLRPDTAGRLPLASEASEMAGTPCYMAPEMLGATGKISERTDVYLLGAILYEILAGEPPHKGTFKQIVGSILLSNPKFPPGVPVELADIATKAMSRDAADRYASAEELRLRLEWYLRHRGSLALAMEARKRLVEMRAAVASDAADAELRERLYHLFAEARFGFRQAIGACEDAEHAREGLREAIETVVAFELDRGTPEAASAALAELEAPPPDLVERVADALRAREREKKKIARLEEMRADLDPTIGRRTRFAAAGLLATVWTVAPQLGAPLERRHPDPPYWVAYVWTALIVAFGWRIFRWGRESLSKTAVNRRLMAIGGVTFAMQFLLEVGCRLLETPYATSVALHFLVWTFGVAVAAVTLDRRFWAVVPVYMTAFLVVCTHPSWRWHLMSACNFSLLVTFAVAWWRPSEDRPRSWRQDLAAAAARQRRAERDERSRPTSVS